MISAVSNALIDCLFCCYYYYPIPFSAIVWSTGPSHPTPPASMALIRNFCGEQVHYTTFTHIIWLRVNIRACKSTSRLHCIHTDPKTRPFAHLMYNICIISNGERLVRACVRQCLYASSSAQSA